MSTTFCPRHHVHDILSMTFCPMTFCPHNILSATFCPWHFVRWHFVRPPLLRFSWASLLLGTQSQVGQGCSSSHEAKTAIEKSKSCLGPWPRGYGDCQVFISTLAGPFSILGPRGRGGLRLSSIYTSGLPVSLKEETQSSFFRVLIQIFSHYLFIYFVTNMHTTFAKLYNFKMQ